MPRMDNSDEYVLDVVNGWREDNGEPPIVFDEVDPGATPPIDICWDDWVEIFDWEGGDVEHPPYDFDLYQCAICGVILSGNDD